MIKFRVHPGNSKFLQLIHTDTELELQQIEVSFRRKSKAAKFDPRVKKGFWDGYFNYFEKNCVPIGLWDKVVGLKKFGLDVQIEGLNDLFNLEMTNDLVKSHLIETLAVLQERTGKIPYDYQIEAITNILKWVFCSEELATSAGKTLILYLIISYLNNTGFLNKILIVVPNTNLVIQTAEEFIAYGANEFGLKIKMIYGGQDENIGDANIIIGTYQSLTKKDANFFKDVNAITIDECFHPDSLVSMSDGSQKKISEISIGEKVLTRNEINNNIKYGEVDFVYENLSQNQMYQLETIDGRILKVTGNHKVFTKRGWIQVENLTLDDEIYEI